jgi:hypothetical protein
MGKLVTKDLVEFMESGASILVGTRDASLKPECLRGVGAHVGSDSVLHVFLNKAVAARTLANVADNGLAAVTFSRVVDHKTLQVKGRVQRTRDAVPAERAIQERYVAAFAEQVYFAGLSRSITKRIRIWPSAVMELVITDIFEQTPGPNAGRRLGT